MSNDGYISVRNPLWLSYEIPDECFDEGFKRIMKFFVFYSPCPDQSSRMVPLSKVKTGWKENPWHSAPYLRDKLDTAIFSNGIRRHKLTTHKEFADAIGSLDLGDDFYNRREEQRFCVVVVNKKGCTNLYMSFFYHLRNMLAHARIAMYPARNNDICFVMEDGRDIGEDRTNQFLVSGRAVILKSSLLKLIDVLENPPVEKDYSEDVLELIKMGKNTKGKIIADLEIDENIWRNTIGFLRLTNKVEYQDRRWKLV